MTHAFKTPVLAKAAGHFSGLSEKSIFIQLLTPESVNNLTHSVAEGRLDDFRSSKRLSQHMNQLHNKLHYKRSCKCENP